MEVSERLTEPEVVIEIKLKVKNYEGLIAKKNFS